MADKIVVMHDGRVEQVGSPLDLYDRPDNLFVAGFIGSPAMNLIPGRLNEDRAGFVTAEGIQLPVGNPGAARPGEPLIYGVRPESFQVGGDIPLKVAVVEPTGSETHVSAHLGSRETIGVFRERIAVGPGEVLPVSIDLAATHLFDAGTGLRVSA